MANNNKQNKGNNSQPRKVTVRGGFLGTAGPRQQRSTIPMKQASMNLMTDLANAQYFNEGRGTSSIKQAAADFLINAALNHPKTAPVARTVKYVNDALPPGAKMQNWKLPQGQPAFSGVPMKSGEATVMNSSYGLSKAPNPKPVYLNSGIAANTYANDFMTPVTDACSPLHMSCVSLRIPTSGLNDLANYFTNTICFDIQTRAQANINFELDVAGKFSAAKLVVAFNAAIKALQIYYYYASILSYESDASNKNSGMINLRQNISPQLLSDLSQLGKRLEDTPIPPRIVEWVRYLSMNYLAGNTQGSPILKLGFDPTVMDSFSSPTPIANALAALVLPDNNNVFTLLRRSVPQWRVGTLYDVPTAPVYDLNFLTIFANLGTVHFNGGTAVYGPVVATKTDFVSYNSFNNKLDGVAFAMGNTFNSVDFVQRPGLCEGTATTTKWSRRSFYSVGGGAPTWENAVGNSFLTSSRIESYQYPTAAGAPVTTHLFSEKAQGVSASAMTQTSQNVLDFLFNIKSIPINGKVANFNKTGSARNNSRK